MKLKLINITLSILLLAGSCKKQLEKEPTNAVPAAQAFQSDADFKAATLGMYFEMVHADYYIAGQDAAIAWTSTLDVLADNLIAQQTGRGSQKTTGNWQDNASGASPMFQQAYTIIRSANIIVENIDNIPKSTQRDDYYGEALAVRAMVHFDLLRVYSKPVSGPNADLNSLGVSYVTSSDLKENPDRGTVKETYDRIVADLKESLNFIALNNGVGRLNKTAVNGLLSRVYLYGGEWQKATEAATACLAVSGDPGDMDVFPKIWTDATEKGVLFKIKVTPQDKNNSRSPGQAIKVGVGYNQTLSGNVNSEWVCSYSLFQLFKPTDVRTESYIFTGTSAGVDYNAIGKYYARDNGDPLGMVDIKYLRVAEVLLNQAEAYAMLGNDAAALTALDLLRENRYSDFAAGTETGADLKTAIALERRLELAFEGDRWFDLKRKGLPVHRDSYGDRADGTGTPYYVKDLAANDYRWQYPLPLNVVQANTSLVQNPGY